MSARSLLVVLVLALLVVFTVVNWGVFVAPTRLSLVVTSVEAPLGVVLLGFIAVLAAVLFAYVLRVQFDALAEGRRQAEELRRQRDLADKAEASRFTDLRRHIEQEVAGLRDSLQQTELRFREDLADATNSLEASVGEVHERLERLSPTPPEKMP